jgi:hypothetical protein
MPITRRLASVAEHSRAHVYTIEGHPATIRKTSFGRPGEQDTALIFVEHGQDISSRWVAISKLRPGRNLMRIIRAQDVARDAERAAR